METTFWIVDENLDDASGFLVGVDAVVEHAKQYIKPWDVEKYEVLDDAMEGVQVSLKQFLHIATVDEDIPAEANLSYFAEE